MSPREVPRVPWDDFAGKPGLPGMLDWRQGEHVALVGPTGRGKTTLSHALLPLRQWVVVIVTKPKDDTSQRLRRDGYRLIKSWPPSREQLERGTRFLLWPPFRSVADRARQASAIGYALDRIFADGSWCVVLDEQEYVSDDLGCRELVRLIYKQGRSIGVSLVAGNQRPRWVPRETWTQATHLFIWGTGDREDIKALGGLGVANQDAIRATVPTLGKYEALYVNARTGVLAVTQAPKE